MDGRKLETVRITIQGRRCGRVLARCGKNPLVVLEATHGWYWAADVLDEAGAEVRLAHPLGVKAFSYRRVKNDERDASDLADWHGWADAAGVDRAAAGASAAGGGPVPAQAGRAADLAARTRCTRCWPS